MVRANAARLLLDAFPMEEITMNRSKAAEGERFLGQQYEALYNLLLDDCSKIRAMGELAVKEF